MAPHGEVAARGGHGSRRPDAPRARGAARRRPLTRMGHSRSPSWAGCMVRACGTATDAGPRRREARCRCRGHGWRVGTRRPQEHGRAATAVCALWPAPASDQDGAERVQETGGAPGPGGRQRPLRLSGVDPGLDTSASGRLGEHTPASQQAETSHQEVPVAMGSHHSSCPLASPVSEALPEVAWALPVRRDARNPPPAGGHRPRRGAGVALLAELAQQHER